MGFTRGLQDRFGFTRNEIRVILFLSVTFVAGSGIRWYRQHVDASTVPVFDYSRSDSEFVARSRAPLPDQTAAITSGPPRAARKQLPAARSINLNTASIQELMRLPGIGEAYARRVVAYRLEHGPFNSVDDLINIKGIGPKKLEKLRRFLTSQ
jgi:competence protein ComEA